MPVKFYEHARLPTEIIKSQKGKSERERERERERKKKKEGNKGSFASGLGSRTIYTSNKPNCALHNVHRPRATGNIRYSVAVASPRGKTQTFPNESWHRWLFRFGFVNGVHLLAGSGISWNGARHGAIEVANELPRDPGTRTRRSEGTREPETLG